MFFIYLFSLLYLTEINRHHSASFSSLTDGMVRYVVSVEAASGDRCSSITSVECYTEQGIPPVVTGITTDRINGISMRVSWTPPNKAESNGFILGYTITFSPVSENVKRKRQSSEMVSVSGDSNNVVITGLNPELAYEVSVTATTAEGTSERELLYNIFYTIFCHIIILPY